MAKQAKQKYRDAEIEQAGQDWNILRGGRLIAVRPTKEAAIRWIDRNTKGVIAPNDAA